MSGPSLNGALEMVADSSTIEAFARQYIADAIQLVAITPDGPVSAKWFGSDAKSAAIWADRENRKGRNIHWTPNIVRDGLDRKAAKKDILAARYAHLDIDPPIDIQSKHRELTEALVPPSLIVFSGGGIQAFWTFDAPNEDLGAIEDINKRLATQFGGDHCHNIDRLMRLPGTVNWPNKKKTLMGRAPALARLLSGSTGTKHAPASVCSDLPNPMQTELSESVAEPAAPHVIGQSSLAITPDDLGLVQGSKLRGMIERPKGEDRSRDAFAVACEMIREGFDDWQVAGILTNPQLPISAHCREQADAMRAAQRTTSKARTEVGTKAAATTSSNKNVTPLRIEYFADIQASLDNHWLVRDLIPENALALIYGAPGSGKSFLALDISLRIATGMAVDGRPVNRSGVVYLAAEGQGGFRRRVDAFRRLHDVKGDVHFGLIPSAIDLLKPDADLIRLIASIQSTAELWGAAPGLIVIDTLAATFGGGDENGTDMLNYVNNLCKVRDQFQATVMAVHHRPKDHANDTPRGHSSLMGAMDTMLIVNDGSVRTAKVKKQKDAEAGSPIKFNLESVPLGTDSEGDEVTSAVVKYLLSLPTTVLAKQPKEALDILAEAIAQIGTLPVTAGSAQFSGPYIAEQEWRQRCADRGLGGEKEEGRRKAFNRAKIYLTKHELIAITDGHVWQVQANLSAANDGGDVTFMDFSAGAGF